MKKILNNNFGFTLTELLVAASLFVIVLTFGTNIYLSITKTQKSNYSMQKILNESRFLLDMIANDIQSNYINYETGVYPNASPEDELRLQMSDGSSVVYALTGGKLDKSIGSSGALISSDYINITKLDFYIYPLAQNKTEVPFAVIVWQAEEIGPSDPAVINLQTAVSLRNY